MLTYNDGKGVFIESNWLTPYKIRNLIVTGKLNAIMRLLDYLNKNFGLKMVKKAGSRVIRLKSR
jgi:hypothetical protein